MSAPVDPSPPAAIAPVQDDDRLRGLRAWLDTVDDPALRRDSLRPASSDASFRRYFRLDRDDPASPSRIVMDAPPAREDSAAFIRVARRFSAAGVATPQILAADLDRGYLLLTDLGNTTYADAVPRADEATVQRLYLDALAALVRIQQHGGDDGDLPPYDHARLAAELRLFPDWYLDRHLGVPADAKEAAALATLFERLIGAALAQPHVDVHRDFHSRNLMVLDTAVLRAEGRDDPGVLDMQDAVRGPITYDLVSLLRDAYVEWPEQQQIDWAVRYWERARAARLPVAADFGAFWRDLEWMGLQRHLKVLGIFARLHHRDGKDRYLADLPRVLRQVRAVARRYDAFAPLLRLLDRRERSG